MLPRRRVTCCFRPPSVTANSRKPDARRRHAMGGEQQTLPLPPLDAAWDPTLPTNDDDEYCWTPLQLAARGGDLDTMRKILHAHPCAAVNDSPRGYYGQTALQAACMQGHDEAVRLLVAAGADVHAMGGNNMQRNALQIACGQGNERVVDVLLDAGARVEERRSSSPRADGGVVSQRGRPSDTPTCSTAIVARYNGRTALQAASERGHERIVRRLLHLGADVNAPASPTAGLTALQAAASNGFTPIVRLLLRHGADANAAPARTKGHTALQGACLRGHLDVVDVLLNEAGADVDAWGGAWGGADEGGTALHAAAEKGHVDVVRRLLRAGADVNACGARRRQTAVQSAAAGGHEEVVRVLREWGARGGTGGGRFLFS
ncbi:hypothetical protein JDV02_010603 [Purpureocillium takamizusanense]|uniref:Ankyrin repeat protein n=1 Tax=Purpureocillium takamizusanense TaxID=2060973 RepID=A0A9Q8QUB6_9HYPO|nr:uncharacterized protein JDV02_010603 [Purpureocillium takamizusanense]UNI24884.1 hypothetical protein JDV02_010603 [Purpureocillium takamizusanense]